jgi:ABC-type transport system involved in multi-copper enzyme maturation permease subunit
MRQLLYFELKKIINRRANQVAMLLGLLLMIVSSIMTIQNASYYDGSIELNGMEAIRKQMEMENESTAELSEEFLTELLTDYQPYAVANPDGLAFEIAKPRWNLFSLIARNYAEWNEPVDWSVLGQISTESGVHFYERRMEKIETLLNAEYSFGNYTDEEKAYWQEKAEMIQTPFPWSSPEIWKQIWTGITMQIFLMLIVCFCTASVFTGEYQNRTDALLLTTRYGRRKAVSAKIAAALIFVFFYMILCSLTGFGIITALLGTEGGNLPVQLVDSIIPYPWTMAQVCGMNVLVILVIALFLTAFSLLLSTICKNSMIVLAVDIAVFFGTAFLPSSKSSSLWNKIAYLFPLHCFDLHNVVTAYNSYYILGIRISYPAMIFIVYICLTILCLLAVRWCFHRHQIKS